MRTCATCRFAPCVCWYILKMREGGELADLRPIAASAARDPQPHRAACPCLSCVSFRLSSWGVDE